MPVVARKSGQDVTKSEWVASKAFGADLIFPRERSPQEAAG